MGILVQFLLRLSFGLAAGMAATSAQKVSSGYFRNHLYVTLGLVTLATLVSISSGWLWWPALTAAVLSYAGSVCWLYERPRAGYFSLWLVAALSLIGAVAIDSAGLGSLQRLASPSLEDAWHVICVAVSGLVLGLTAAAMLLGHWYLNAPGMELAPLRRLLIGAAAAVGVQAVLSGIGLAIAWQGASISTPVDLLFVLLRWVFGIIGPLVLFWMAWRTLEIPNTQSATGILYVAVIATFTGELAALLLSAQWSFLL